ncbi:MAG: nucleotidyltransferase family protein [Firmicutes bacterium]|jgi:glucose-1-phosphate thymidylyltransferase|nr:nucleotidyltransferase family protein [Bacillota bacterium]
MKAIILAAGYATRLYPLTINKPKALLTINEKPIINYIVEQINTIDVVDEIYVVTNHKFIDSFADWQNEIESRAKITVLDDGTTSEQDRKGAIGDIAFVIQKMNINDELLVVAGDNFFTYPLKNYYDFYKQKDKDCVCVKVWNDEKTLRNFGIALLDQNNKVLDIEEKPENPKSNTVVFAMYLYQKDTIPLFEKYLSQGNNPDAPGNFPAWLYKQKEVYAYTFKGECYDIGTPESYQEVQALFQK